MDRCFRALLRNTQKVAWLGLAAPIAFMAGGAVLASTDGEGTPNYARMANLNLELANFVAQGTLHCTGETLVHRPLNCGPNQPDFFADPVTDARINGIKAMVYATFSVPSFDAMVAGMQRNFPDPTQEEATVANTYGELGGAGGSFMTGIGASAEAQTFSRLCNLQGRCYPIDNWGSDHDVRSRIWAETLAQKRATRYGQSWRIAFTENASDASALSGANLVEAS